MICDCIQGTCTSFCQLATGQNFKDVGEGVSLFFSTPVFIVQGKGVSPPPNLPRLYDTEPNTYTPPPLCHDFWSC
jgi:hypothetical protein